MSATISCLALSQEQADRIVRDLHADRVDPERISVLLPDPRRPLGLAFENDGPMDHGPVVGIGTAAGMGSLLGWVAGIAAIAIPGVGAFFAAGPILAALGTATAGATLGAIAGGLVGMGMPEAQAQYYDAKLREGQLLIWVEVHDADEIARIEAVFTRHGGTDIHRSAAAVALSQGEPARRH